MIERITLSTINVKITIQSRSQFPIRIGHDVNCDDHATDTRTMWSNHVIERRDERERENGSSTRIPHPLLDPRCRI